MVDLHDVIVSFARRRPSPPVRYLATLLLIGAMSFLRSPAPADVAPFPLYIPVLLVVSLACGWEEGSLTLALSAGIAGWFIVEKTEDAV